MNERPTDLYLLRMWWEPTRDGPVWRATLLDPVRRHRAHFATPAALLAHLSALLPPAEPAGERE